MATRGFLPFLYGPSSCHSLPISRNTPLPHTRSLPVPPSLAQTDENCLSIHRISKSRPLPRSVLPLFLTRLMVFRFPRSLYPNQRDTCDPPPPETYFFFFYLPGFFWLITAGQSSPWMESSISLFPIGLALLHQCPLTSPSNVSAFSHSLPHAVLSPPPRNLLGL